MKHFLSIQDFSKLSGISISTLRYWDDIGIFSPSKRNPENNYRYYTPDQMIAVNFITVLSDLKVPLKKIHSAEQTRTPEGIIMLIEQQEKKLAKDMRELEMRYSVMVKRRELISYGMSVKDNGVSLMHMEEMEYVLGPRNKYNEGDMFFGEFTRYCQTAAERRINLSLPIGGFYENMDNFIAMPGCPDYFMSIDPTGNHTRSAGKYLVGYVRGYYGDLNGIINQMTAFAEENMLSFSGPVYITYLHDEVCISDTSQYLAEVCASVTKKRRRLHAT